MNRTIAAPIRTDYRQTAAENRLVEILNLEVVRVAALLALHAVLALGCALSPLIATAHAGATLLCGLWVATYSPRLERVAVFGAYIAGSEVLWRMSNALLPWEFGKYATILIFVLALLRAGKLKGPIAAFLFFILLLPSIVLPLANVTTEVLTDQLSFNLSGPLALMISVWFFSHLNLTYAQLHRLLLALTCPAIAIAVMALRGIVTAKELVFVNDSNFVTSGGYGPNQVSAVLGLGALATLLWALDHKVTRSLKMLLLGVMLYLMVQSAMTFSRTGLYLAAGGAALALTFLIQDKRLRRQLISGLAVLSILVGLILLPWLDKFTEGTLMKRFSDTKSSGRAEIMLEDWRIFSEHPFFGVGPGQAKYHLQGNYGSDGVHQVAAHNEFARLLAEHGMWGLTAILVLLYLGLQHFKLARTAKGRALNASMIFWSFGFLFTTAMRIVAPSLIFGLTAAFILPEPETEKANHH
jgi:O-antigen ligase